MGAIVGWTSTTRKLTGDGVQDLASISIKSLPDLRSYLREVEIVGLVTEEGYLAAKKAKEAGQTGEIQVNTDLSKPVRFVHPAVTDQWEDLNVIYDAQAELTDIDGNPYSKELWASDH